jgi:hypothetical protein
MTDPTPMTREPDTCPTCGAVDPDAAVLAIATSPEGLPLPCPDLWHHDTSDAPAPTPMTREQAWETLEQGLVGTWEWDANDPSREALAFLRSEMREAESVARKYDTETTSIHADMLALARLVGVPYDWVSSPAGFLHGDIMPAVSRLRTEMERLEGERDDADLAAANEAQLADERFARAEAAEAQLAQAMEALARIAALAEPNRLEAGGIAVAVLARLEQGDKDE